MATSTTDILTPSDPLAGSVTYGSSASTSSGSLPNTFGDSANLYSGSTWSSSTSNNSFAGAENNPYAGGGGYAYASLGNTVVGDNQWIIGKETTPERFSKVINYTTEEVIDSAIVKLTNRLSESGITTSSTDGNPFAGGNNPFGSTNAPALDFLRQVYGVNFPIPESASEFLTSVYGQTLPGGSSNPFPSTGTETSGTGGGNPFAGAGTSSAGGSNPFAGAGSSGAGVSIPQQPSFDITQVIFGESLPSGGSGKSSSETLRVVQDGLLNFTKTVNSAVGQRLFSGNNTPLKSPSDLLTLFKNDILSANTSINTVNDLAGGGEDPYNNLTGGSGSQAVQPSSDILYTVLGGLLPFSGTDNIFNTPDGSIPVGYGNKDFGSDSAVIGNSNWNYGQSNASIGNANWNWDYTKDNATIGNGNWYLDSSQNNRTLGNGNWYWESTAENNTLGNGNWHFGNNNTTIGNGNWDFGSNNTIIGNGNRVFTSNSIVIGNGNWSVIIDKSSTAAGDFLGKLDNLVMSMGIKDSADNLVNSLIGKFGGAFEPLTGELTEGGRKTYNQLFYSDNSSAIAAAPSP
ncbi:hypothetical protein WA1_17175 [Scytonema hofmannii PCC 7110]|uniref:Uncharacterized protein n=1 Tax=Scytonema hofmannii PCC 7110 TaxID=128403 RepID=A0A139XAP1_9CYAN|nr:hypothetical protein [Scytonema hofmannii]KYC41761.1 hypothetical protein WA1_17175 [Scytonema hofmannii PCC 7110]